MIRYTAEEREWLTENVPGRSFFETIELFSERFRPITYEQLKSCCSRWHLRSGVKGRPRNSVWDDEREAYFVEIVPGREESEIRALFLERYGVELTEFQINNAKQKLGVKSGTHGGRFKKGNVSPTKGRKIEDFMPPETLAKFRAAQFKPGNKNGRDLPLGSTYVDKDGLVYIKVSMDGHRFGRGGKWKQRSHIEWEKANGREVPDGHVVIHCDGDAANDDPGNLVAVSMADRIAVTQLGAQYADKETYNMLLDIANVKRKAREAGKGKR